MMSVKEAHQVGCHIIGVCSGGELAAFCEQNNYDYVLVPGGNPPRSALAFSVVQLLDILSKLGLIARTSLDNMVNSVNLLNSEKETIHSVAKDLADFLYGKVGIFYSETKYEGVIVRARQQVNENSKYLGWQHTIPEMNHNELVGWTGGDARFAPVFFCTGDLHPRNQKRLEITMAHIESKCGKIFKLEAKGSNFVERSIYLINLVDWASYFLCNLNGADIIDIQIIDYLKGEMAKFNG
jgi:glucose/mannose-6-phosphate isomerase